jgi:hypothetical protein
MRRLRLQMMAGGQKQFILDKHPNAFAAYSLRKLRNGYSGSAIRVRRASDNAEQNIGFDINGNLDTSGLASFCSGTNGFVTTWYDQTGNSENLIQTTAVSQPKIFDSVSGTIVLSSKPAITFDAVNDFLSRQFPIIKTQPIYSQIVSTFPTTSFGFIFDSTTANRISILRNALTQNMDIFAGLGISTVSNSFVSNTRYLYTTLFNSANSYLYQNSVLRLSGNSGSNSIGDLFINSRFNLTNFGNITTQEFIFWAIDQTSNRVAIETDIKTYYGIP